MTKESKTAHQKPASLGTASNSQENNSTSPINLQDRDDNSSASQRGRALAHLKAHGSLTGLQGHRELELRQIRCGS